MKKIAIAVITIVTLISLGACTKNKQDSAKEREETSMPSKKSEETDATSHNKEQSKSIFKATLIEDAKRNETVDKSLRLVLNEVEAIEDPEKIIGMMKNDGVILNVSNEQLADGVTENELKKGDKIQFTLAGLPAMTMSIPPQVVGNSVVKVEKN